MTQQRAAHQQRATATLARMRTGSERASHLDVRDPGLVERLAAFGETCAAVEVHGRNLRVQPHFAQTARPRRVKQRVEHGAPNAAAAQ